MKTKSQFFEIEIESCIEYVVSGIDFGEDTETLEETLSKIKELQEKHDKSVQEFLDVLPSEDADTLCSQLSKVKNSRFEKQPLLSTNARNKVKVQNLGMVHHAI